MKTDVELCGVCSNDEDAKNESACQQREVEICNCIKLTLDT